MLLLAIVHLRSEDGYLEVKRVSEQHFIVLGIIEFYQRVLQDGSGLLDMHRSSLQLSFRQGYFGK